MAVDYSKLWKLLIEKKINKTDLRKLANITTNSLAKMGKNEMVSLKTLQKICFALNCNIGDIIDIIDND